MSIAKPSVSSLTPRHIAVAYTGASGLQYGLRLTSCLLRAGVHVSLMVSDAARVVAARECDLLLPSSTAATAAAVKAACSVAADAPLTVYDSNDWFSPLASGSAAAEALVVCPCSMDTLAHIAHGLAHSLITRAADVVIKEGKKLILLPREMPLSAIHLQNMLTLAQLGVCVMPPCPGFYQRPQRVEDLLDFVVARVLAQLQVAVDFPHLPPWGSDGADCGE